MVHQAIVHSLVFIDIEKGDAPLMGLESKQEKGKSTLLIRRLLRALAYLPPITISMIVAFDIYTLFGHSVFRASKEPLLKLVVEGGFWVEAKVVCFELFAVLAAIYTMILCQRSRKFSRATADTLGDFETVIKEPDEFLKDPDGFLKELARQQKENK